MQYVKLVMLCLASIMLYTWMGSICNGFWL